MVGSISIVVVVRDGEVETPAVGLRVQAYWVEPHGDVLLRTATINAKGTTDGPIVSGTKLSAGTYRLLLHAGDFFRQNRPDAARCLDGVPVVFVVDDAATEFAVAVVLEPTTYAVSFG